MHHGPIAKRFFVAFLVALGLLAVFSAPTLAQDATPTVEVTPDKKTVWEYKVVTASAFRDELGKAINSSVGEGWDFVSASGPNDGNWGMAVLRRGKD